MEAPSRPSVPVIEPGHPPPLLLGRAWLPDVDGPAVVTVRGDEVIDITSRQGPTVRDVCEMPDPAAWVASAPGRTIGPLAQMLEDSAIA